MASATSSFLQTVAEARAWFEAQDSSSTLDKVDEKERRISVTVSSESLYIVSPETPSDQWVGLRTRKEELLLSYDVVISIDCME